MTTRDTTRGTSMTPPIDYTRQSRFSDPGPYLALLDALPTDIGELATVVNQLIVHYRAGGYTFTGDRLAEIDHRWLDRLLATDQRRFGVPLTAPRPEPERVAGCCRDYTLLTVAALRHRGVPARSRVGFAGYFAPDFHHDHVIAEYWNGEQWTFVDANLPPGPNQLSPEPFTTAAQAWTAYRAGTIDPERYGVGPDLPYRGAGFIQDEVLLELAHRQRDEVLLWDHWGAMLDDRDASRDLVDGIAALLLAADAGDEAAEQELADRYASNPRLHPGERVLCHSPTGHSTWVDLRTRKPAAA